MPYTAYQRSLGPSQIVYRAIAEDPTWAHPLLSGSAQTMFLLLLVGRQNNAMGFFYINVQSLAVMHGVTTTKILEWMDELVKYTDFLIFDPETHRVIIRNYLRFNPPATGSKVRVMLDELKRMRKVRGNLYEEMLLVLEGHLKNIGHAFAPSIHALVEDMVQELIQEKYPDAITEDTSAEVPEPPED